MFPPGSSHEIDVVKVRKNHAPVVVPETIRQAYVLVSATVKDLRILATKLEYGGDPSAL
jgi:hypothetical protein